MFAWALLVVAAVAGGGGEAAPEVRALELETIAAEPASRAAVVIDKGDGSAPTKVCIRFDASSISGEEALRLAADQDSSIAPVFSEFSGKGKAVCALCGVGCPSGDCFCDPQRYWAYHRAESGSTAFKASPVGVSSSEVTDGDVEGYRWGSGAAPAAIDIQTICGEVPAETTTTAAPPPPPTSAPPETAGTAEPERSPGAVSPPSDGTQGGDRGAALDATPSSTAALPPTTVPQDLEADAGQRADPARPTTTEPDDDEQDVDGVDDDGLDEGEEASVRLTDEGQTGGGGSGVALAGVGATVAAMVAGAVGLQRSRRQR